MEVNRLENETHVCLTLQNGDQSLIRAIIRERIPRSLTDNLAEVRFEPPPPTVVDLENQVVEWTLRGVLARESKRLEYTVPRLPSPEFDPLNWFLVSTQFRISGFFRLQAWAENFMPGGTGWIFVNVWNFLEENLTVEVSLQLPSGFFIMGQPSATLELGAGENRTAEFLCSVHEDVRPGIHKGRARGRAENQEVAEEFNLQVLAPPPFPFYWILLLLLAGAVGILLLLMGRRRKRGYRWRI
ncbi:MAG: hypothetical protein QXW77_03320 [Candidatus Hadarchaeales archaeon]